MDSEIAVEWPMIRVYKSGRVERLLDQTTVPPSMDPQNGVVSKDTIYSPENNLFVRIFLPHKVIGTDEKLPVLVYFHGGGFVIETPFSPTYHTFLTLAVAAADCIAVSVDYRLAPEHHIPVLYEDSWAALKWVFTHYNGTGSDDWLNKYADFTKVSLAGDSAGGNITHHMGMRAGKEKLSPELSDSGISGIILVHPYFWSKTPIDEQETRDVKVRTKYEVVWIAASPNSVDGVDDPLINVVASESVDLTGMGCGRVLVMVAEKDKLVRQGLAYAAKLEKSGWKGEVKVLESKDEDHCFHLKKTECDNAILAMNAFVGFIKGH